MGLRLVLGGQAILYLGQVEHETLVDYELALHRRAAGYKKEVLAEGYYDDLALDPSGRWIALEHGTGQHARLVRTDLRNLSSQTLTEGPGIGDPVVGPRGDVVRPINHWIPGCSFKTDRLVVHRRDGSEVQAAGLVVKRSAAWAGERLLWREYESCSAAAHERLMTLSDGGQPTTLAVGRRFDDGEVEDAPYAVTSDGRWVLASSAVSGQAKQTLYAIATDGSGEKILARDLVSFDARVSWGTPLYRATADARYVVYAASDGSLRAVLLKGGRSEVLTTSLRPYNFYVAPAGDAVVYATGAHNHGGGSIWVTRAGGEPTPLHKLGKWIRLTRVQFAADAATFHFITQSSDHVSVLHRGGVDGSARHLMSYFSNLTISSDGCLLVFRPEKYSSLAQGTYLWAPD